MSIGIGTAVPQTNATATLLSAGSSSATGSSGSNNAVQTFLNYMKETPAQRFEDQWLAAHGLTSQELQKMPAAQREAIEKKIAQDIKTELQQQMAGQTGGSLGTAAAPSSAS